MSLPTRPFSCFNSLTMSYFHTGIRTIIGAEAFHCPVRDGKEWDHLAMVIRLNRLLPKGSQIRRVAHRYYLRNQHIDCVMSSEDSITPPIDIRQNYRVKPHEQLVLVS